MSRYRNESFASSHNHSSLTEFDCGRLLIASSFSNLEQTVDGIEQGKGPVSDQIVSSCTPWRSSIVDLWPARSIHVTSVCERGANGRSCQATHFGLSDSLFDEDLLSTQAKEQLANMQENNGASSSWKATFMSTRERFSSPAANPIQLKLGGPVGSRSGQGVNRRWAASPPPQLMTTSGEDWSSFEKLFGERQPGSNLMATSGGSGRMRLTPSPTPTSVHQGMPAVSGRVDDATAKEIETRFVALNDLIKGIAFLGTNGAAPGPMPGRSASQSAGPMPGCPQSPAPGRPASPSVLGSTSRRSPSPVQQSSTFSSSTTTTMHMQQKSHLLSMNSSNIFQNQKTSQIANGPQMPNASLVQVPPIRGPHAVASGQLLLNANGSQTPVPRGHQMVAGNSQGAYNKGPLTNGNGSISSSNQTFSVQNNGVKLGQRRIPDLTLTLDPSAIMVNSTDSIKSETSSTSPRTANSNNMALKIIDEVQQFLQTNTETLKKSGRFPAASQSPRTPTSPTSKAFSNLSDQLTRQVVDERYPTSSAPSSPSASTAVRRAMLDHHHFHYSHRSSSSMPRQHHVPISTGSVAERVNQFEHVRLNKRTTPSTSSTRIISHSASATIKVCEDARPSTFFHFQLPNSVAGVSASIVHQPSVVTSAASTSTKLQQNGTSSYQEQRRFSDEVAPTTATTTITEQDNDNGDNQKNRAAVLNEIEKALQGLPAGTSTSAAPAPSCLSSVGVVSETQAKPTNIMPTPDTSTPSSKNVALSLRSLLNRRPSQRQPASETAETMINKTVTVFRTVPGGKAEVTDFGRVCRACGLPACLKKSLFSVCCGGKKFVVQYDLTRFWMSLGEDAGDEAVVLVRLLSSSTTRRYLVQEDFVGLVQTVVDDHPGLAFLREAPEFHSRYVQTVIARIFFGVNRSWSGRMTAAEIRRSNLIDVLRRLDDEEDINRITQYFSYEHFYVIYCKFWELDRDHDLLIDKEDLSRFDDYALSRRAIDRIFSPALINDRQALNDGKMTYPQFVKFILAEKDKRHPTSIEYWFRCMDLDGDGIISIYELQYFYDEQAEKMILCGIEPMPFVDILCQVMDMVRPRVACNITLTDLKQCKMAPVFFDTFLNLHRYLEHEQMESGGGVNAAMRSAATENNDCANNEWNMYAAEEYEALVAEEADMGTEIKCDDDSDEEER